MIILKGKLEEYDIENSILINKIQEIKIDT